MIPQKACLVLDLLCILPPYITLKPDFLTTFYDYIRNNSTPKIRFMHLCIGLHASNSDIPTDWVDEINRLLLHKDDMDYSIGRYQIRLYTFLIERLNSINTRVVQDPRSDQPADETLVYIRPVYQFALSTSF